jgi:hypothetical protein
LETIGDAKAGQRMLIRKIVNVIENSMILEGKCRETAEMAKSELPEYILYVGVIFIGP